MQFAAFLITRPAKPFLAGGTAALILMILASSSPESQPVDAGCPPGSIIAIGDSITLGAGLASRDSYPAQLSTRLGEPVCNAGVNGDTAIGGLRRLDRDVLQFHPKAVVVLLGANDLGLLPKTGESIDRYRLAMTEIVRRIQRAGATPFLCSLTPLNGPLLSQQRLRPENWSAFDAAARQVAVDENIPLVDLGAAFAGNLSLLQDVLHPTAAGARTMAAAVEASIRSRQEAAQALPRTLIGTR